MGDEQTNLKEFGVTEPNRDEHVCPTCGRGDFDSRRALSVHHSAAHDTSLPSPTTTCEVCGDEFDVAPHRQSEARFCSYECAGKARAKDGAEIVCETCDESFRVPPSQADSARFCSDDCRRTHQSRAWTGDDNPRWEGGAETVTCEWCGDEYDVRPAKAESSTFCSLTCKGEAYAEWRVADDNPRWEGGAETVTCEWCGDEYDVKPAVVSLTSYCSKECQAEARTVQTGQDNPNWQGGVSLYRAVRQQISDESWRRIREQELATQCRVCGATGDLHLHHIIPLKRGGTNESWNLLTLCRTHHKYAEEYTKDCSPLALLPAEMR